MTVKKTTSSTRVAVKKLKLKRETLQDLDAKGKAKDVKGGKVPQICTGKLSGC